MGMDFVGYLRDGLRVLGLQRDAIERLAADRDAFGLGLLVVLIAGLAQGLKGLIIGLRWWGLILDPILMLLIFLVGIFLVNAAAFLLGGASSYVRLLRPAACGFVIAWVLVIPFLGVLALLWYLVALTWSVRWVHRISTGRAVAAVAIPIGLVVVVLALLLGLLDLVSAVIP
jgi:hypothetical protein